MIVGEYATRRIWSYKAGRFAPGLRVRDLFATNSRFMNRFNGGSIDIPNREITRAKTALAADRRFHFEAKLVKSTEPFGE